MKGLLLALVSIFSSQICIAQGPDPTQQLVSGPDWINGLETNKISGWLYYSDVDMSDRMASSSLTKFPAKQVSDGYVSTAWAAKDSPIGEVIVVDFDAKSSVFWVWTGNGKSSTTFLAGNRPRKIKVFLVGTYCADCTASFCVVGNFVLVNSIEVELQDINEFQMLPIPQKRVVDNSVACGKVGGKNDDERNYVYKLGIQVLSIYKGTESNSTFISEIMNHSDYTQWLNRSGKK
ncbi:hypothetical protein BH09BAC3_BH09BAC3_34210 [soil metagenome]